MAKNAFYAQSGGVTAVINASAQGVIETARQHPDKIGKVYAGRNGIIGALTEDLIDTSHESADNIAALRHTPAGRFRFLPLQAQGLRQEPGRVRAPDRGVQGTRHRLFLLQRRRRFGRHLPQGLAARRKDGLSDPGDPCAQDHGQRPAAHRHLPRLRLGGQIHGGVDPRGGLRSGLDGQDLDQGVHPRGHGPPCRLDRRRRRTRRRKRWRWTAGHPVPGNRVRRGEVPGQGGCHREEGRLVHHRRQRGPARAVRRIPVARPAARMPSVMPNSAASHRCWRNCSRTNWG